jgi:transposase
LRAPTPALPITDEQRSVLETLIRSRTAPHRDVQRARALLVAADGFANARIAGEVEVSPATVAAWRKRFSEDGLKNFSAVRSGRGRRASIPAAKLEEIVRLTLHETPPGETHWSCWTMAARAGVSSSTVQRIWSARGIKPHRVETFKLSNDPQFEEKLVDVVGLYLNPPEKAVVLCMDEKSQIQALDRTQPSLPIKPRRAGTMTHDYKRNGTTTLFAALDVLTGSVIGQCLPRHRHAEFLAFLKTIDREVPKSLQVHLILDNYATHNHPNVKKWLAKHPRFELYFTPTVLTNPTAECTKRADLETVSVPIRPGGGERRQRRPSRAREERRTSAAKYLGEARAGLYYLPSVRSRLRRSAPVGTERALVRPRVAGRC